MPRDFWNSQRFHDNIGMQVCTDAGPFDCACEGSCPCHAGDWHRFIVPGMDVEWTGDLAREYGAGRWHTVDDVRGRFAFMLCGQVHTSERWPSQPYLEWSPRKRQRCAECKAHVSHHLDPSWALLLKGQRLKNIARSFGLEHAPGLPMPADVRYEFLRGMTPRIRHSDVTAAHGMVHQ